MVNELALKEDINNYPIYCCYCQDYVSTPHTCQKITANQTAHVHFESCYRSDQTNVPRKLTMSYDGGRMSGRKRGAE